MLEVCSVQPKENKSEKSQRSYQAKEPMEGGEKNIPLTHPRISGGKIGQEKEVEGEQHFYPTGGADKGGLTLKI